MTIVSFPSRGGKFELVIFGVMVFITFIFIVPEVGQELNQISGTPPTALNLTAVMVPLFIGLGVITAPIWIVLILEFWNSWRHPYTEPHILDKRYTVWANYDWFGDNRKHRAMQYALRDRFAQFWKEVEP